MLRDIALMVPFLIAFGGLALFSRLVRSGLSVRIEKNEKKSARRWIGMCILLLVMGPAAHGLLSLIKRDSLPPDAIFGCWFLIPMICFFLSWNHQWEAIKTEGPKWGYSTQSAALLLRFIIGGIVVIAYYWVLLSVLGVEVVTKGRFTPP